jgi:hypothetical protein
MFKIDDFKDVFTDINDSLSIESSRDPMGMQVLWSFLGQRIFKQKLTTVANDIRNFTLNLINHSVIKEIALDHSFDSFWGTASSFYKTRNELIRGLIIFLENLFIFSLISINESSENEQIETHGLLGYQKGIEKYENQGKNPKIIKIENSLDNDILKRQISLGVNGRYKGPFTQIGLLNKGFTYTGEIDKNWENVEKEIFNQQELLPLKELRNELHKLTEKTLSSNKKNPEAPSILFNDEQVKKLGKFYSNVFGEDKPYKKTKEFWIEKLGLKEGPANILYDIMTEKIGKIIDSKELTPANYKNIFEQAKNQINDAIFSEILMLEPILARLQFCFDYLMRRDVDTVPISQENFHLNNANGESDFLYKMNSYKNNGIFSKRIEQLYEIYTSYFSGNRQGHDLAKAIYEYHKTIMNERGGSPWFTIKGNNHIAHSGPTKNTIDENDYQWIHSYYLDTLKNIVDELERT